MNSQKNFDKVVDRNSFGFMYFKNKISKISDVKVKDEVFVGPPIRVHTGSKTEVQLCEVKKQHENRSKNHYQFSGKS